MERRQTTIRFGFTLVELLTTLAVIGILLGLLIPALNQVGKTAAKVKQKAQFHAIGTALETFRNDYGDYPPSAYSGAIANVATASHKLAEALIGRDGLGFHPASRFRGDGLGDLNGDGIIAEQVYHATIDEPYETAAQNIAARKGPYLELESANAVQLGKLRLQEKFPTIYPMGLAQLNKDSYVLVDMYKIVKNSATGKEVGMPILYYKANKLKIGNEPDPALSNGWLDNTYNYNDALCGMLGFVRDVAAASTFYSAIANPNFTSPARPYRADSFLLQSAGPDGLYGTTDDMFNFDQDN